MERIWCVLISSTLIKPAQRISSHSPLLTDWWMLLGLEMMSFLDEFFGYNYIQMHPDDQEKKPFMAEKEIYCYKVMPFGLKNAGATYQRLVNRMFKDQLENTMEVYINDMLVKLEKDEDQLYHLRQTFDVLKKYKIRSNPTKCTFGGEVHMTPGHSEGKRSKLSLDQSLDRDVVA